MAISSPKDTLFGVCTLLQGVGYKGMVQRAFSERLKESVRRYAIRVVGGAGLSHSRLCSTRDLHAGASLAVRKRP
jgi:hypothetical protein